MAENNHSHIYFKWLETHFLLCALMSARITDLQGAGSLAMLKKVSFSVFEALLVSQ